MLNQTLVALPRLSALLEHPDFQQGLARSQEYFLGGHKPAPLSLDEMIAEVESELHRRVIERNKIASHFFKDQPCSYLESLGYVFGTVNAGLAYASTALIMHPDFLAGVEDAEKGFYFDGYDEAPLTEDQMIALVEKDLSRSGQAVYKEMFEDQNASYFWFLGYVFGIINEGLAYAIG